MGIYSDVLLTVDFDRTLTAPDSSIPERNLAAIRYFMENGGVFTVNTGRSLPMTKVFRDIVPVNAPLLLYNGSAAYDLSRQEILDAALIPLDKAATIRRAMALFPDMTVEVQGLDAHYIFAENPAWVAFSAGNRCAWAMAGLNLLVAVMITVLMLLTGESLLRWQNTPSTVFTDAQAYINILFGGVIGVAGAIFNLLNRSYALKNAPYLEER